MKTKVSVIGIVFLMGLILLVGCKEQAPQAVPAITLQPTATIIPKAISLGQLGKGWATDALWSVDGKYLYVKDATGISIYETDTWKQTGCIPEQIGATSYHYKLLGTDETTGDLFFKEFYDSNTYFQYNHQTNTKTEWFSTQEFIRQAALSPDNKYVAEEIYIEEEGEEENIVYYKGLEIRETENGNLLHQIRASTGGYDKDFNVIRFSADNSQIALGTSENIIKIWDVISGEELFILEHDSVVNDLDFSPDGSVLVSTGEDATVRFWDMKNGDLLHTIKGFSSEITRVAFIDSGKKLLVGEKTNQFSVYSLDDQFLPEGKPELSFSVGRNFIGSQRSYTTDITYSIVDPNHNRMIIIINSTVSIWDLKTGQKITSLPEYNAEFTDIIFSPDSTLLAAADHDIHLWRISDRAEIAVLPLQTYEVVSMTFSPDSNQMLISTFGEVQLWDLISFSKIKTFDTDYRPNAIAYTPDGKQFVIDSMDGLLFYDIDSGEIMQKFGEGYQDTAQALKFSNDGSTVFAVSGMERSAWDVNSGEILYRIHTNPNFYRQAAITNQSGVFWDWRINSIQEAKNPEHALDIGQIMHFYDLNSGEIQCNIDISEYSYDMNFTFSPDGSFFIQEVDSDMYIRDAYSGRTLADLSNRNIYFGLMTISADNGLLASVNNQHQIDLWDISSISAFSETIPQQTATPIPTSIPNTAQITETIEPLEIQPISLPVLPKDTISSTNIQNLKLQKDLGYMHPISAAWSNDGSQIAFGTNDGAYLFEKGATTPEKYLHANGTVDRIQYSEDDKLLAAQTSMFNIIIWNIETAETIFQKEFLECFPNDFDIDSDNQTLTAYCANKTIKWDMLNGNEISNEEMEFLNNKNHPYAISAGGDKATISDWESGEIIKTFDVPEMMPVSARFSPDNNLIAIWFTQYEIARTGIHYPGKEHESLIQIWDISDQSNITLLHDFRTINFSYTLYYTNEFTGMEFSLDSKRLFICNDYGESQVWNLTTGILMQTLQDISHIYIHPDGKSMMAFGDSVKAYDIRAEKPITELYEIIDFSKYIFFQTLTDDDKQIITINDETYKFWQIEGDFSLTSTNQITIPDKNISESYITTDKKWVIYITDDTLKFVELNPSSAQIVGTYETPYQSESWLAPNAFVSPDNKTVLFDTKDDEVLMFSLDNITVGPIQLESSFSSINEFFFPQNGRYILGYGYIYGSSSSEKYYEMWDVKTGKRLRRWDQTENIHAFHPNGIVVATSSSSSNEIFIRDVNTWRVIQNFQLDDSMSIRYLLFSPDGSLLVVGHSDGISFYDSENSDCLFKIPEKAEIVQFSSDGTMLITKKYDERIQIWGISQ
jgi:WD40 repeat protein